MANIVFDASVVLALLYGERMRTAPPNLRWASMSAVNAAEVWTKLAGGNDAEQRAGLYLLESLREIVPFTVDQAKVSGDLQLEPGVQGLSLGDRACLSLALSIGADVFTADRVWSRLKLPCAVHCVR